jgi:signal transduction histidine kinase
MPPAAPRLTVEAMASQDPWVAAAEPVTSEGARPWAATGPQRIAVPVSAAVLIAVTTAVCLDLPGRSAGVIGASVAALAVAVAGVACVCLLSVSARADTAALMAVGFAGTLLGAILPATPAFVLVYLALAGLGMRLPLRPALTAAVVVFAAMNLAYFVAGKVPVLGVASQDIGAAFLFAIGAFTRSSRIVQEQARVAQSRAEDLLKQLQASHAAQAEAAAFRERARLAREIHDILAHALSGLVLALDTMELLGRQASADPRALEQMRGQVSRAQRMARDGLADTRRAIGALRGDELPGPALLDRLVLEAAATTGVRAELAVSGLQRPLSPEVGLALYRTAQEALTNTAKYAGAGASAEVRLTYAEDAVELVVQDRRSDSAHAVAAGMTFGGYGLTGMRERAELLGGSLTAGPTDLGFGVCLRLPAGGPAGLPGPVNGAAR